MKYIKTFENKIYCVALWCYNKCDKENEILAIVDVDVRGVKEKIIRFRELREEYRRSSSCRTGFTITVDNVEIKRMKDFELLIDMERYNL